MDFRILGPLEVLDEGREVALGGSKQRALLAVLVLHANETLSTDRLIEELWGEHPPATAAKTVQVHVSRLRKALASGGDLIVTRERGYRLELDPDRLDAHRFERLLAQARDELAADRPRQAAAALDEALALWRGEPLADLAYEPFAQREVARLADLRVAALELRIDARLALGGHAEVIGELEALIAEHPFRERLRAQLMLALYRADRQADALQAYQDARRKLVEELGIEPGERLRELERAILAQDPALALPVLEAAQEAAPAGEGAAERAAGEPAPSAPPAGERSAPAPGSPGARRLVSIVFADLVGSTGLGERLDPESMHALLDRYIEVCGAVIERHGGTVEGFIGDAVVGVFGLAELHEDDALRAVRAAVELREAGAALSAELERERGVGIAMKFGVESGEVFLRAGARSSPFAAGDAFNVASRLEGSRSRGRDPARGEHLPAGAGPRASGAAGAAGAEGPRRPRCRLGGCSAWRPTRRPRRSPSSPFVDRERELEQLRGDLRAGARRAGLQGGHRDRPGRHRQVARGARSWSREVGRRGHGGGRPLPLLRRGRDLPHARRDRRAARGRRSAPSGSRSCSTAKSRSRGWCWARSACPRARPSRRRRYWAVRRLLERVAAERPLLVVVEDVHWAEPDAARPARVPGRLLERAPDPARLPRPARSSSRPGPPG